jgi:hypothetical protein
MNYKRIGGAVACLAGIALIIYAVHTMNVVSDAKKEIKNMSSQMSRNYVGKKLSNDLQFQANAYDTQITIGLSLGVALVVVGAGFIFFHQKKKKR